jgi:hypothetical protein
MLAEVNVVYHHKRLTMSQQHCVFPQRFLYKALAVTCALILNACGGGGNGGGEPSAQPPQTAPFIVAQPQSTANALGTAATFSVSATGSGNVTYQWTRNGAAIPNATAASFTQNNLSAIDSGAVMRVAVSNAAGTTTSSPATINLTGPGIYRFAGLPGGNGTPAVVDPSHGSTDGLAQEARFDLAAGVGMDAAGVLYVADSTNDTLRKITPNGLTSIVAGAVQEEGSTDGAGASARFKHPYKLVTARDGTVFMQDVMGDGTRPLRKISPDGIVTTLSLARDPFETNRDGTPAITTVVSMAVAPNGDLLLSSLASMVDMCAPSQSGNVCTGNYNRATLRRLTPQGSSTLLLSTEQEWARVHTTYGAAASIVDASGNFYFADPDKISRRNSAGVVTILAGANGLGSIDGIGTVAQFNYITSMTVDAEGNLFVLNGLSNSAQTIRKVTPAGVVTTVAGNPNIAATALGNLPGSLTDIRAITINAEGVIFASTTGGILKIVLR